MTKGSGAERASRENGGEVGESATPSPAGSTRGSMFPVDARPVKMDARVKPAHDGRE